MILNLGSLAFNANLLSGGGTPAWGTELGQGEGYKFSFEDMSDFFTGMVYTSVPDIEEVTCPLGKGGNQQQDYDFVIASLFTKVFVNGKRIKDATFLLLIVKKIKGEHHVGRRTIKYNPKMTYKGESVNEDCFEKIPEVLDIPNDSAWFVHEINIKNQDELHFTVYVLGESPKTYSSIEERKRDFISRLPKVGTYVVAQNSLIDFGSVNSLQQIFYGAPGTGKSHEIKKQTIGEQVIRTTFHPDSDYSTFVGAYKPTTKQVPMRDVTGKVIQENKEDVTEDRIIYEFVEQAFLQAYTQAWRLYANADDEQPKKQFLVIEEINRGNCAQIFGDLFQLLDRNDAGFSEYPIKADRDMRKQLAKAFAGITITDKSTINQWYDGKDVAGEVLSGEVLLLPSNLFIWATMNTSDQSLFPIDSAFKRRWDWQYIPISNANKGWKIKVNGKLYDWWDFLEKMNEQINATTNSEDKKMGYFFCKAKNGIIDAKTFVGKVVFYVWNDVFKDFANEAGGIFKDGDGSLLSFNKFYHVVNGKTEVLEDKVELLLNNLGVVAEGETIDVEELEKNASANSSKNYLKEIVFPDGTIYSTSEMTHFDAYMAAIRKIGIERVASVADKLKYRRLNRPLISAEKYEEIENSAGFSYYQEGSYFFVKGVMTYTLVRILEDLNEMLNVGMTINN